jgi:hypothetical protein
MRRPASSARRNLPKPREGLLEVLTDAELVDERSAWLLRSTQPPVGWSHWQKIHGRQTHITRQERALA